MGPARVVALEAEPNRYFRHGLLGSGTLVAVALWACGGTPVAATDPVQERRARLIEEAQPLLTPTERAVLAAIEGDRERARYLAEIGVAAELAFRERLRPGLAMGEVEAFLGAPEDKETESAGGASFEYWTYRGAPPAGEGEPPVTGPPAIEVKSVLQFRDGRLLMWKVERRPE